MDPLTVEDMERALVMGCQVPGCTHENHDTLYLDQRCHPKAGVSARYTKGSGKVVIECFRCKKPVFEFLVASSNQQN